MGCKNCRSGKPRPPGPPPGPPGDGDDPGGDGGSSTDEGDDSDGNNGGGPGPGPGPPGGDPPGHYPDGNVDPDPPPIIRDPPGGGGPCVKGYHLEVVEGKPKCVSDNQKPPGSVTCDPGWVRTYVGDQIVCLLAEIPLPPGGCPPGYLLSYHNGEYVCRKDGPGWPPNPCDPGFLCENPGYHPWDNDGRCDQCLAPPSWFTYQMIDGKQEVIYPTYAPEEFKVNRICVGGNSTVVTCNNT